MTESAAGFLDVLLQVQPVGEDVQGGSSRGHQQSAQVARRVGPDNELQTPCLTLGAKAFMTALQRKRRSESALEACKRKAARLARMDGFLPRFTQPSSLAFPISPMNFDPETSPNVDLLKTLLAPSCQGL